MKLKQLGNSELHVSELILGTMSFGQQNTEAEAHEQLNYAIEHGINCVDAAEMYPVPGREATQGRTETYVGNWLKHQSRDGVILTTKVTGPNRDFKWIRGGPKSLDRRNIVEAVEGSLKRLRTDYVDLYQIHWPERNVPMFGQTEFDPILERDGIPIHEQLETLAGLIKAGKIRYIGLSNETPWGVCEFTRLADQQNLPRVVSIQNVYNLINRTYESGLAEAAYRTNVSLLVYSPLAFGHLTAKYLDNNQPPNSRMVLFPDFGPRYRKPNVIPAISAYRDLALKLNLTPAALALAFVRSRWFVSATIIGATTMDQLKANIHSTETLLSPETLAEIEAIHTRYTNPAP